jgi:hypothetical protein
VDNNIIANIAVGIFALMVIIYVLDIVFHIGIFDKLIEFLERDNKK